MVDVDSECRPGALMGRPTCWQFRCRGWPGYRADQSDFWLL